MNRKEYNSAVSNYSGRLYGYCIKYLRNEADASDIVQDVFEKLWKNRKKVDPNKTKSWLFTCAHNALLNFIGKKNRMIYMHSFEQNISDHNDVGDFEIREMVEHCLSTLPPVQKSIILLRDLEGYNYQEIGEILSLSASQVKVYLFRARNKIKKQIKTISTVEAKLA